MSRVEQKYSKYSYSSGTTVVGKNGSSFVGVLHARSQEGVDKYQVCRGTH